MRLLETLEAELWRRVPEDVVTRYQEKVAEIQEIWDTEQPQKASEKVADLLGLTPGERPGIMHPGPLTATLLGGLAGAGLGYGAGWLGEKVLPSDWKRNRLRYTLALAGGGLGAAPGLAAGAINLADNRSFGDNTLFQGGFDPNEQDTGVFYDKRAALRSGTGLVGGRPFSVDNFNHMVWNDPDVAGRLSPQQQALATGVVTSAAHLPGKRTRLVTPYDMGRMAAGMGSGFLAGATFGHMVGLATGMPPEQQKTFRQAGMMAGLIANAAPMMFG